MEHELCRMDMDVLERRVNCIHISLMHLLITHSRAMNYKVNHEQCKPSLSELVD